ncbi:MAG: 4-amino-4-deoxychorismate lyase [Paraglaciecola sp.]|jgi:4-amino-4-deoxychorismate lyase
MIVNGQSQTFLNLADRAVQYGDGCFTTISVTDGKAELWAQHLQRLKTSCERLHISFTEWQNLQTGVETLILDKTDAVLKIIISRGEGGRGYGTLNVSSPNYILSLHDKPDHFKQWQQVGISLTLSPIALAKQPILAGIKHLNRLEQVLIKQSLEQTTYVDAVVCDTDKMLIETSMGNLFWRQGSVWYTPELDCSGVEGVMRNHIMEMIQVNRHWKMTVQEVRSTIRNLTEADEVFVCNSLMKVVPVTHIDNNGDALANYKIEQVRHIQQNLGLGCV